MENGDKAILGRIGDTHSMSKDGLISGLKNRVLQNIARSAPGATGLRVTLHRWRGVHIGEGVWIGYDAIIETAHPDYVTIKAGASIGIRAVIIAHFPALHGGGI